MDDWPPKDQDYTNELAAHKLRKVDLAAFKREPELDEHNRRKVY